MKKEDLIYKDKEYEIYKKDVGVVGSMLSEVDLLWVGIHGLPNVKPHLKNMSDYLSIIDEAIDQLERYKLI